MKVSCLSGTTRKAGGLFYAVSSLCRALAEGGTDIAVFGRSDPFFQADSEKWGNVSLSSYNAVGPLGFSMPLRRLLLQAEVDIVHQHGIWLYDQWAALQWQKKTGKPVVVSPHGMLDPWALKNSGWKKRIVEKLFAREAMERATCIHALCRSEADSIRAYGLKNPIAIVPNGVELPELGLEKAKRNGRKQLLYLGRIHPKKGLKELLNAWGSGQGKWRRDWKLLIAGWDDGGHEQGLQLLAKERELGDSVEFVGPRYGTEKDALLRSSDAFILPSFSEGLPMSVLEAWSYGLPVVMTDFCNLSEGFDAGAAFRIEPTADSIARGMAALVALSDAEREAMGIKGRKLVESKFTWSGIAADMHRVYDWCLTGGKAPECVEL